MEFWYIFFGVAAFALVLPYLRCLVKRLVCRFRIKRICRRMGYRLERTHPLWFLGHKRAKNCDFYIETEREVFAVKLFGVRRRLTVLIVRENGEYMIRRFLALPFVRFSFCSKPRPMPVYDFRDQYKEEWEIKTPHSILLVHPVPMEIRRQERYGGEVIVGAGDTVNGMEVQSLARLLGALGNAL